MTIRICDVCKKEGKLVESKYRGGYTHSVKVDLCVQHKDWVHSFKNRSEFVAGYVKLLETKF
jgi:hypothetical protein